LWRCEAAQQVVAQQGCPAGCGAARLHSRLWRSKAAQQEVPRHNLPGGERQ